MERFVIIVNGWKPLTIITKQSILDAAAALDPPLTVVIYYWLGMSSTTYKAVKFSCAIQGYYVNRNVCQSKENESFQCDHEPDNDYDLFAIYFILFIYSLF